MAQDMLHVISAWCAACDLHTIASWPPEHTCWRQSAAERGDYKKKTQMAPFNVILPAKWLCDASSVLVGVWLLVTLRFQPSPLASKLLSAPRKGEQSVSLSLPVHSLSTASPVQCLLVAAGVYGCRKAPEPNCKGEIGMTQRQSRWRRTKVPTAAKADEVVPSCRLNSPTPAPSADQVEENLQLPTVVKVEEGNTLLQVIAVGQMVLASPERQTVYAMETQNTNPGRMDPPTR